MKLSTVSLFKNLDSSLGNLIHIEGEALKKYQKILVQITEDVVSICEENHIVIISQVEARWALYGTKALFLV